LHFGDKRNKQTDIQIEQIDNPVALSRSRCGLIKYDKWIENDVSASIPHMYFTTRSWGRCEIA